MKGIVILVVVLGLGAFAMSYFLTGEAVDRGRLVAVGYGAPQKDTIQLLIGVAPGTPMLDPPQLREDEMPDWPKWIADHYQLRDESGEVIPMKKMGTSALMQDRSAGIPDFVVFATITQGKKYTCDFIPVVAEGYRYRLEFTAPDKEKKGVMTNFEYVKE